MLIWLCFLFLFYVFPTHSQNSRADLIVGAPFYYDREAGGAVYVYSNPPDGGLTANTPYVKLVGKPESRYDHHLLLFTWISHTKTFHHQFFLFSCDSLSKLSGLDSRWPISETLIKIATKTWPWARLTMARASSTFTSAPNMESLLSPLRYCIVEEQDTSAF